LYVNLYVWNVVTNLPGYYGAPRLKSGVPYVVVMMWKSIKKMKLIQKGGDAWMSMAKDGNLVTDDSTQN